MIDALSEMYRVLKPGAKAVLVIGDVKERTTDVVHNLAEIVYERCARDVGFVLCEPIIADTISDDTKVSKI